MASPEKAGLAVRAGTPLPLRRGAPGGVVLRWLGQAGFLVEAPGLRLLIDPYLSDSLAAKYAGKEFPHLRLMPPPAAPQDILDLDWCLATHAHSDHLDPGTLPGLAAADPRCRFAVPASAAQTALARGVPPDRLVPVDAAEPGALAASAAAASWLDLGAGASLLALPSAHEKRGADAAGHELYLGYVLSVGGFRIYHSGDCVPYEGLAEALRALAPDLALLPVNGRDAFRASRGVPGNFSADEAFALAQNAGIPCVLAHHYGLFDFNTVSEEDLSAALSRFPEGSSGAFRPARLGEAYTLYRGKNPKS